MALSRHVHVCLEPSLTDSDLPESLADERFEISALEPEVLLNSLAERGLGSVWVDGAQTLKTFLAAGLVDMITVTRIPVLIGEGRPLFGALSVDLKLEHLETTSFESGVFQSRYKVKKQTT